MNARRYPRTLQEAFGPYTDNTIYEPRRKQPASAYALAVVYVIAAVVLTLVLK